MFKNALCLLLCGLLIASAGCARRREPTDGESENATPTDTGDVAFVSELFGDDPEKNYYNYCPTVLREGDDTLHIWYCSNKMSTVVTDYVAYRKGTLHEDGKWTFTEKAFALTPGKSGTWDARHTCDPSVIRGAFAYGGKTYSYLMAYLGCKTNNSTANEVGLAFAEDPAGPWVKYGKNPIADYYGSEEFDATLWGYGQPSLVSADGAGRVLLFYTKGVPTGTFTQVELWDLSDMENPEKLQERTLSNETEAGVINNADFAYDAARGVFYCVKEDHLLPTSWYPTDGGVDWVGGNVSVWEIGTGGATATDIFGDLTFTHLATIDCSVSGFARNHNAGLVTDAYGRIDRTDGIAVVYTVASTADEYPDWPEGGQWPVLHTFRLHGYVLP